MCTNAASVVALTARGSALRKELRDAICDCARGGRTSGAVSHQMGRAGRCSSTSTTTSFQSVMARRVSNVDCISAQLHCRVLLYQRTRHAYPPLMNANVMSDLRGPEVLHDQTWPTLEVGPGQVPG